jgi:hypothetical protein
MSAQAAARSTQVNAAQAEKETQLAAEINAKKLACTRP